MRGFFFWTAVAILVRCVKPPISLMVITAPGSNATLECSFSASQSLGLTNLVVNWQHGDTVVHSFYLGQDQLDRQGESYKGRTHLLKEALLEGNASLVLTNLKPEDQGEYTCHVNNEQGSFSTKLTIELAALFDEPILTLQPTCDSFNISITVANGFPQPELRWHDSSGRDIPQTSLVELDARGCYKVSSYINYRPNDPETITMEMKLDVLNQHFTRSMLLHPPPDPCKECCLTSPSSSRNMTPVVMVVVMLFIAIIIVIVFYVKKQKRKERTST